MRSPLTSAALALSVIASAAGAQTAAKPSPAGAHRGDPNWERARRVLSATPLVDGHNDLPWRIREDSLHPMDVEAYDLRRRTAGMTDLARMRAGMLGAQFWSVYIPGEQDDPAYRPNGSVSGTPGYARVQLEEIDIAKRVIAKYSDRLAPAYGAADVRRAFAQGKVGSLMGMEGGHAIENSLGALRAFYDAGVRYMTLTHNVTLDWADAALDSAKHGGLTPFGEEVVREMNRLGMLVDLSHVSEGTMSDALRVSEAPVIFSHSSARALADSPRNVPDSILRLLPKNGGVVMVTFVPGFVSPAVVAHGREFQAAMADIRRRFANDSAAARREGAAWRAAHPAPRATLADVADHVEHVRKVAGVDHVGIGGDFDGITDTPDGLEDVSKYPALFAELSRRGWSDADLRKLAGENVLRVLRQAEDVSARLRRERAPSTKTIQELDGPTGTAPSPAHRPRGRRRDGCAGEARPGGPSGGGSAGRSGAGQDYLSGPGASYLRPLSPEPSPYDRPPRGRRRHARRLTGIVHTAGRGAGGGVGGAAVPERGRHAGDVHRQGAAGARRGGARG